MEVPSEPVIFMKATSAICGPNDPIIIPRGSEKTDWEVELAVVIGKRAKYVSVADALDYVAGYAVTNDVSEREFQLEREGNWTKGKSCDNFGQIGPWLVTKDEVSNSQKLSMWLTVNGKKMQNGSTKTMVYGVAHILSYLSQFMSLHPVMLFQQAPLRALAWGRNRRNTCAPVTWWNWASMVWAHNVRTLSTTLNRY